MKIAIVNQHVQDKLGGSEIQCDNIASGLADRGHDVFYIAVEGSFSNHYSSAYHVIPVEKSSQSISQEVLDLNPDVIYWRYNKNHFYKSVKQIKKNDIKIIFAISSKHDVTKWLFRFGSGIRTTINNFKSMLNRRFNHGGFRYVDAVTSLNPDYLDKVDVDRQVYVPNCMDSEVIPFNWPNPYIFWVASIKEKKRPGLFVKLAEEIEDVDFIMVGEIQQDDYKWIHDKNEELANFHYLGKRPIKEVNGILKSSLFLVHTCKPEGFGNNFIQAWLQAKPTISLEFDPGGYIEKYDIGYVCNANFDDFVDKTGHLIQNKQERIEKGKRAYEFASDQFSVGKTVALIEELMEEIVSN